MRDIRYATPKRGHTPQVEICCSAVLGDWDSRLFLPQSLALCLLHGITPAPYSWTPHPQTACQIDFYCLQITQPVVFFSTVPHTNTILQTDKQHMQKMYLLKTEVLIQFRNFKHGAGEMDPRLRARGCFSTWWLTTIYSGMQCTCS